ncbi:MAG: hypothetical protein DCC67_03650 [Planctomycetota bacterium]|nr:MAG: hypothetical protein DCC67_03650 [Planctomycetota bacterium]
MVTESSLVVRTGTGQKIVRDWRAIQSSREELTSGLRELESIEEAPVDSHVLILRTGDTERYFLFDNYESAGNRFTLVG